MQTSGDSLQISWHLPEIPVKSPVGIAVALFDGPLTSNDIKHIIPELCYSIFIWSRKLPCADGVVILLELHRAIGVSIYPSYFVPGWLILFIHLHYHLSYMNSVVLLDQHLFSHSHLLQWRLFFISHILVIKIWCSFFLAWRCRCLPIHECFGFVKIKEDWWYVLSCLVLAYCPNISEYIFLCKDSIQEREVSQSHLSLFLNNPILTLRNKRLCVVERCP